MPNDLPLGSRRNGDLIDFDTSTPEVKVTLERTERGISLTVPWSDSASRYARWFLDETVRAGGAPIERVPVPPRLLFHDSHGVVMLVDTWAHGFHANLFGPGSGTVWARYAVLDVGDDLDFTAINGLRTDISGLRAWLGVTSWDQTFEPQADVQYRVQSKRVPSVEVGDYQSVGVRLVPTWAVPDDDHDQIVLQDILLGETRTTSPASWSDHLAVHQAIRDLLVLSRWRQETCVVSQVTLAADVLRTLDGREHGEQWRQVVHKDDLRAGPPTGYRPHLIRYDELGAEGVARWLHLRDGFARALDPVLSSLALTGGSPFAVLAQMGPGLEALGYLLSMEDGLPSRKAAATPLRRRFDRILTDVGHVLPFDGPAWAEQAARVYNGLKHANRAMPEEVDLLNVWREGVLAVRAWVALRLGLPAAAVRARLEEDPQRHPYVRRS